MASRGRFIRNIKTVIGGTLAAVLIRMLSVTIRWECVNRSGLTPQDATRAGIFVFWHGRMLMLPSWYFRIRGRRAQLPYMLISQHGDGRLIAFAVRLLGIHSIAGSSTRGGANAALEMIEAARNGSDVGLTPDGPKGPRYECKDGVVLVATKTSLPVYPMSYSTERRWQLGSWDGMIIPKPFSRGVVVFGEPIDPVGCDDPDQLRMRIQDALRQTTERADGHWASL